MIDLKNSNEDLAHSGFVAIIGRPNVGKSTLFNQLAGMKLAIVSAKPQTTRQNARVIINSEQSQIIFIDTPGIHRPKSGLSEFMVHSALRATKESDAIVLLADGRFKNPSQVEIDTVGFAHKNNKKLILAINKTDQIEKEKLLPLIQNYSELYPFEAIIPISARTGDGIDVLIEEVSKLLPPGPRYYSGEAYTDQTERELASEMIREQILHYTHQEIPHGTAVIIEQYKEADESDSNKKIIEIYASILCEKETHKAIILGKDGQMIKRIGASARMQIEQMTGQQVYLDLHVKVRQNWKNKTVFLNELGYKKED